jgi:hypothetical protein
MGKRNKQTCKPAQEMLTADTFVDNRDAELYEDEDDMFDIIYSLMI